MTSLCAFAFQSGVPNEQVVHLLSLFRTLHLPSSHDWRCSKSHPGWHEKSVIWCATSACLVLNYLIELSIHIFFSRQLNRYRCCLIKFYSDHRISCWLHVLPIAKLVKSKTVVKCLVCMFSLWVLSGYHRFLESQNHGGLATLICLCSCRCFLINWATWPASNFTPILLGQTVQKWMDIFKNNLFVLEILCTGLGICQEYIPISLSLWTCHNIKLCFFFSLKTLGIAWPVDEAYSRLTSRQPERFWTSGQWMTERQGGSDVGQWLTSLAHVHHIVGIFKQLKTSIWRASIFLVFLPQPMVQRQLQLHKQMDHTNCTASSGSPLPQTQTWPSHWPECKTAQEASHPYCQLFSGFTQQLK